MALVAYVETPPLFEESGGVFLAFGANGAALGLLCAWLVDDRLAARRGEERENDLLGVYVIAIVLVLLSVAEETANIGAAVGGGLLGALLGPGAAAVHAQVRLLGPLMLSDEQVEAAVRALSDPERFAGAERTLAVLAPQLQRVLAYALEEGGWFGDAHRSQVRTAAGRARRGRARRARSRPCSPRRPAWACWLEWPSAGNLPVSSTPDPQGD